MILNVRTEQSSLGMLLVRATLPAHNAYMI
jgi:hypothetical protein